MPGNDKKHRYALIIEYLGTPFAGSQVQPGQKTVQSEVERALGVLMRHEVKTVFAGRTDSGVHALGQVAHFDTDNELDPHRFLHSLNAITPDEISIQGMQEVDCSFHSRNSAHYRWYRYIINNRLSPSVLLKNISLHVPDPLDITEMQCALAFTLGEHDFSGFRQSNTDNPARVCNMMFARCRNFSGIIYIDLIANRFLYNMVRTMVGTLLEVGRSRWKAKKMLEILQSCDRENAGPTAKPQGLTLMGVGYSEKYNLKGIMELKNEQNLLCKASRS
jgi:tRNA pseudouridine38-40 synthase